MSGGDHWHRRGVRRSGRRLPTTRKALYLRSELAASPPAPSSASIPASGAGEKAARRRQAVRVGVSRGGRKYRRQAPRDTWRILIRSRLRGVGADGSARISAVESGINLDIPSLAPRAGPDGHGPAGEGRRSLPGCRPIQCPRRRTFRRTSTILVGLDQPLIAVSPFPQLAQPGATICNLSNPRERKAPVLQVNAASGLQSVPGFPWVLKTGSGGKALVRFESHPLRFGKSATSETRPNDKF